jgi:FkbH-like protein
VILAVCSKNDEANALAPFTDHPDMVLKRSDIACFVANWDDKAHNLRRIAAELNIGLDTLVFVDDNPVERALVRRELPEVQVPELPEDPADYAACIADGGYFETLRVTSEDLERGGRYQAGAARAVFQSSTTDLAGYLRSLDLKLDWRPFDRTGLQRIVQLINKTNQFNLTTRRFSEAEVAALLDDPSAVTLQIRVKDAFGDNGMVAVVIAQPAPQRPEDLVIDTWLMSCRVLGRQIEAATLNVLAAQARERAAAALVGVYRPTEKNGMVRDLYERLGFSAAGADGGAELWRLELSAWSDQETFISVNGPNP